MIAENSYSTIEHLLAVARTRGQRRDPEARKLDLATPHTLTDDQRRVVEGLAWRAAGALAPAYARAFHKHTALEAGEPEQVYLRTLRTDGPSGNYYLPLRDDEGAPRAALAAPVDAALRWVSLLLGGSGEGLAVRELSQLERELLADVAGQFAAAAVEGLTAAGCPTLTPAEELSREADFLPDDAVGVGIRIPLAGEGAKEPEMALIFPRDYFADVIPGLADAPLGQAEARELMMAHLGSMTVQATAIVGEAELAMRELLSLEPGDVLLLEQDAADPAALHIGGREVFHGSLAQSEGHYALQLVDSPPAGTDE